MIKHLIWETEEHMLATVLPVALVVKNAPANAGDTETGFDPWVGKIPWRRGWQPTPVFMPGEFHWTEEPVGLQSTGSQKVGHDRSD